MSESHNNPTKPLQPYTAPAIIHEGQISTRAGSPVGPIAPTESDKVDPIDLFSNQDGA